jgi:hypothetical protein
MSVTKYGISQQGLIDWPGDYADVSQDLSYATTDALALLPRSHRFFCHILLPISNLRFVMSQAKLGPTAIVCD